MEDLAVAVLAFYALEEHHIAAHLLFIGLCGFSATFQFIQAVFISLSGWAPFHFIVSLSLIITKGFFLTSPSL
jgi:hypothetical protein